MGETQIRQYLSKLDTQKSIGPGGMHPNVLRELTDVIAKHFQINFE